MDLRLPGIGESYAAAIYFLQPYGHLAGFVVEIENPACVFQSPAVQSQV